MPSLSVVVNSPCPGHQVVSPVNPQIYQGAGGTFTYVVLSTHPSYGWLLVAYDYSDPGSPCYPNALFGQVTPNTQDPFGVYGMLVNGTPDTNAGSALVGLP